MKIIRRKCIRGTNWALAGLLTLLGFSSCTEAAEYGTPHATYEFKGKVTDVENNPIQGIKVEFEGEDMFAAEGKPTATTASDGAFEVTMTGWPVDLVKLYAMDVDGEANGLYKKDSVVVTIKDEDFKKGKSWYRGKVSKEVTITMKKDE